MSEETKWTPAPWRVEESFKVAPHSVDAIDPKDGQNFEICTVWGEDERRKETDMSRANARLISAAPDMAGAIKWALAVFGPDTPEHAAILEAMHAALAKARGETS